MSYRMENQEMMILVQNKFLTSTVKFLTSTALSEMMILEYDLQVWIARLEMK